MGRDDVDDDFHGTVPNPLKGKEQPEKFGYWKKKRDTTNCNNHSNDYII